MDINGNVTEAYSITPIVPLGGVRFYHEQNVVKQLIEELNITYYSYDYQAQLIITRRKLYTSYKEMCERSYVKLNRSVNLPDQLWSQLLNEFEKIPRISRNIRI